ncbi:MAG: AraC family transcriptional regulator [Clostridiaceae bacterium]
MRNDLSDNDFTNAPIPCGTVSAPGTPGRESAAAALESGAHMVDYRANARLRDEQVSFHWWNERSTTLHYHNYYEIFLITRGKAAHLFNGSETALQSNTLHLIRPQDTHQFVSARGESCTHMNLLILPERLRSLSAALNIPFSELVEGALLKALLNDTETAFFLDRAEQISLCGADTAETSRIILEMIAEALSLLYRRRGAGGDAEWFPALLAKLRSPEYLTVRASDVYALCPFSAPVLIKRFHESEGCTVVEYLTRVKMDYAQSFLRTTNFPVREIASRLGYDSISHFCRVFKERFGQTPKEYRSSAQR